MIAKLKGVIDSTGSDHVVVDVHGVGYLVFCPARTLARLPGDGEPASLFIETHVREDQIRLYGFADTVERDWFRLLTTVQGVGARVALAVLSVLGPDELITAVAAQDKALITRADGVGPKLAARIVAELKDKAGALAPPALDGRQPAGALRLETAGNGAAMDAVSALVNLGYGRADAYGAVSLVAQRLGAEATVESLIRGGLQELGR